MPKFMLGMDAYATIEGNEVDLADEIALNLERNTVSVKNRSGRIDKKLAAFRAKSIEIKAHRDLDSDPVFDDIRAAFFSDDNETNFVRGIFLEEDGGEGLEGDWLVADLKLPQPLEDVQTYEFTLEPHANGDPNLPAWVT